MARFMNVTPIGRKTKTYRELHNPMLHLDDKELVARFRFDSNGIRFLTELLQNELQSATLRSRAIPVEIQVCVALRYLASNDFQLGIADDFNITQSEVSLIVDRFVEAVAAKANDFVKFPVSTSDVNEMKLRFY